MKPILGEWNVSTPNEETVVNKEYTYWQAHTRLAIIHEIYAGHNSAAYNRLKSVITDATVNISKKYLAPYDLENWLHIIAMSNNFNALKLTGKDRRWLIPKVSEKKRPESYWIEFNGWLANRGGLGIIMSWAKEFLTTHKAVGPAEDAPWTVAKAKVVEESYSEGQEMMAEILRTIMEFGGEGQEWERCVMMDTDFVGLIKDSIDSRQNDHEKPFKIRGVATDCGWFVSENKTQFRDGTRGRLICLDAEDARRPPHELFKEIIPTRIRRLGKKKLIIEEGAALHVSRDDLNDPLTIQAIDNLKLKLKTKEEGNKQPKSNE